ncbi:unnamed protein product, partial [Hapterophycus canaliculatus]
SPAVQPGRNPGTTSRANATQAIRRERHEINRHRLLREVKRGRSNLVKREKHKNINPENATTNDKVPVTVRMATKSPPPPRTPGAEATTAHADPKSPTRRATRPSPSTVKSGESLSSVSSAQTPGLHDDGGGGRRSNNSIARGRNPALEAEGLRLDALKRRRFVELKQMLAYELRNLAREERDRLLAEKASARETRAEAKRVQMLGTAERARLAREQSGVERGRDIERQVVAKKAREQEAASRLEEQDRLRRSQAELAMKRRAELAAEKAAILQRRIERSVRIRRARQLRKERMAAERAGEREAAAEAARRVREQASEKRKTATAEKWAIARAAVEEARRRREEEASSMRDAAGGKIAELEIRAASFRRRQKEIAEREHELREVEAAEMVRERHEAARRKIETYAKRKAADAEAKAERKKQMSLAQEIRKERELVRRRAEREEKEELRQRMVERKAKVDEERRETTRRKLEQDAAKVVLLRSEKERLKATRGKLSSET